MGSECVLLLLDLARRATRSSDVVGNELPCPRLVNARLHANVRITHVDPPLQAVGEEAAAARLDSHGGRSCVLRRAPRARKSERASERARGSCRRVGAATSALERSRQCGVAFGDGGSMDVLTRATAA